MGLNEAALDSPTFRAVTVHFADQVDGIERWLDGYVRTTSKLAADMLALEETVNTHLSKMMPPPSGADAVVDPDYTLLALRRAADGSRQWWTQVMGSARRMESVISDPIRAFMAGDLRGFKEARRALEAAQKTFDTTLARYVGQSKTKEPSALREDAFAVHETRKAYLRASVDFCLLAPQLRSGLDRLLVRVCADVCREVRRSADGAAASSARWADEMERVRGWSKEMEASEPVFRRELHVAGRDVAESALASHKPSRELEDYSTSTVPFLGSKGPISVQRKGQGGALISEKQGWLFLRVLSGKPVRTSWVRRWYYCRDGIFGWLVQGPAGVLQGDEVGVLLCSVKPAVQEERRFCFEVKTKSQTFMLQAETQAQLMEWLEVFEVAKTNAMDASMGRDNASLPGGVDPAFAITPPSIPEFSAKSLETIAEDGGTGIERAGTLPVPADVGLTTRTSMDFNPGGPRRSITMLGREEGETGREHAARIMQKLDLHRKATFADPASGASPNAGGIASLISASHTLIPSSYHPMAVNTSPRQQPSVLGPIHERQSGNLAPLTLAKPPVSTNLSRPAVAASAERGLSASGPHGVSSAVTANYWGSNSWSSSIYPYRSEARKPSVAELIDASGQAGDTQTPTEAGHDPSSSAGLGHRRTVSVDTKPAAARVPDKVVAEAFPPRYPPELRVQHAQFRLLFPTVPQHEKLVLVFNAAWSSTSEDAKENRGLSGNGRIFVTPDNMYFYGHQMGLVLLYAISLDMITEVTAAPGRNCDYIFLHLSQDMNETGLARITIKIFLENLPLLHARLNLLIDDLQAEEPMELPELVSALTRLEREDYEKKSPSVESWDEISTGTPLDDDTAPGRHASRRLRDLGFDYRSSRGSRKPVSKLQLPAHRVVYEPEGMGHSVAERHFEISAKACFHVLFGDKSFIFPKLYFERRAKEIAQGPWELQDHGRMRRQFKFKVDYVDMLGRPRPGEVVDQQTVDLFTDHVTYVVTHVKTPWHLPHSQAFKLVTKVVITHVAKSKCKLAIYTKVDWSKAPAFSKNMVQRQALDDAANDAEELAEIATDQVRKLGPHSRTKRAIQVYGNLGQQKQVVVFTPNEAESAKKPQIKPRTLTAMLFETARSFMESAISSVMMWAFAGVRKLFGIFTAHRVILLLLASSAMYNLVVVSQGTSTWWTERKAARYMARIGVGPNVMMSKAIYLADLEEASRATSVGLSVPQDSRW